MKFILLVLLVMGTSISFADEDDRMAGDDRPPRVLQPWEFRTSVGLDFQISDNELNPRGAYDYPEGEINIGGSAGAFVRRRINHRFGISTGVEFVSRKIEQDYNEWFSSDAGTTRYDVITAEVPIYGEIYMGDEASHTLYLGPKFAMPIYEHCQNAIKDPARAYPCMDKAAKSFFIPVQFGYHIWFAKHFGLTVFIERSLMPIIDKDALEAESARTGVLAVFYF